MKVKLLILSLFIVFQFAFSQTENPRKGKVTSEDLAVQGAEILNLRSKKTTITDANGDFSILAKAKDTLMFIAKNYQYTKLILEKEHNEESKLLISLVRKPEELEEVVITKVDFNSEGYFSQEVADEIKLEKGKYRNRQINDGTIENGADFVRIGQMLLNLFKKEKDNNKKSPSKLEFKELAKTNYNDTFYINTLKLKSEEIALFLNFCDADPKSKTVLENSNPLKLLDFLFAKNLEFKKLITSEKIK